MQGKLQGLETLIDDLLDTAASLPDNAELDSRVKEVHLSHRKLTKEVLRATPDKTPDMTKVKDSADTKPLYRLPKTDMPIFEGDSKLWRRFWERFTQRLAMYPDLPASEKIAQLEQAIKPAEGRALISFPKGTHAEYDACVLSLQQRYDQPCRIYRSYVQEAFERTTPHSRKGLYSLVTSLQDTMNGIELYHRAKS